MSIYESVVDLEKSGRAGVLCTIIDSRGSTPRHEGSKMLVYADGSFTGTVGGGEIESRVINEALDALKEGKIRVLHYKMVDPKAGDPGICGGQVEVYLEPILPKPTILVVGAGHVGKALAHLAKWLDYRVVMSDDRPEFCNPESNPDADEFVVAAMADITKQFEITPYTAVVLTTRGSNVDVEGLPTLLESPAGYLGVIGSRRRWLTTTKGLLDKGIPAATLERVHSPIGLELQAETPEEIAVSIMAEIMAVRNGATAKIMKEG